MKQLLIGYTNPTKEPDTEAPERRQKVFFRDEDLITHLHGVGATRSGKSKWLEWFCRELTRRAVGFTLIDPQGKLAEELLSFFAYYRPWRPVIYFDPSRTDYLVPFNPFRRGIDDVSKRVSKQVEATLKVWGVSNFDETPRLGRVLKCVYYLFATGKMSLNEAHALLIWVNKHLREYAVTLLDDYPEVQDEWREILSHKQARDFIAQVESARNRLFSFVESKQLRRIMSLEKKSLDFRQVFEDGAIVIANLQESRALSEENTRLLGTLIINELWAAARSRKTPPSQPYFLFIDEVEKFITPDLRDILDRGAGKGLHLGVFHQHLTQLAEQDRWTYDSIMGNAKIKVVFGGLTKANALIMADEIFAGQIDYQEAKFIIEQTKFWPVYRRDKVYTSARASASGAMSGVGDMSGERWDHHLGDWIPSTGETLTRGRTEIESLMDGQADIPIFYPEMFREPSSITSFTLEEQRDRLASRLMEQYQRHYFLKRSDSGTIPALTPFVQPLQIFSSREEAYVLDELIKPYGLSVEEIDRELQGRRKRLLESATSEPAAEPASFRE